MPSISINTNINIDTYIYININTNIHIDTNINININVNINSDMNTNMNINSNINININVSNFWTLGRLKAAKAIFSKIAMLGESGVQELGEPPQGSGGTSPRFWGNRWPAPG